MTDWRSSLRTDPTPWLLEEASPPIRYRVLTELLDRGKDDPDVQSTLHTLLPPELPERLSPGQAAELCELLEYLHIRVRDLLNSVKVKADAEQITLEPRQWQNLIDLQARLAK